MMERCSFCGRDRKREVKKIFAGPGVYICDVCIRACSEMMTRETAHEAKTSESSFYNTYLLLHFAIYLKRYINLYSLFVVAKIIPDAENKLDCNNI